MVKVPTPEQLREISASYNLNLSDADVASFLGLAEGAMASYRRLDELVEPAPEDEVPALRVLPSGARGEPAGGLVLEVPNTGLR